MCDSGIYIDESESGIVLCVLSLPLVYCHQGLHVSSINIYLSVI